MSPEAPFLFNVQGIEGLYEWQDKESLCVWMLGSVRVYRKASEMHLANLEESSRSAGKEIHFDLRGVGDGN